MRHTIKKVEASSRLRSHRSTATANIVTDVYTYVGDNAIGSIPTYENIRYLMLDKIAAVANIFGDSSAAFRLQTIRTGIVTFVMTLTEPFNADKFANEVDPFMYEYGFKTLSIVRKQAGEDAYVYYFRAYSDIFNTEEDIALYPADPTNEPTCGVTESVR